MRRLVVLLLLVASAAYAGDKPENWLALRSPHFVVVTNGNEKQARNLAGQFERMRSVFHSALPKVDMDSFAPITVIAAKDDKTFKALEPEAYLAKNSLRLGGLFIHGQEKNYILVRLETNYEHPYEVVYHEYTHLLTSKASEYIPLWLNEGFAEFYANTDIRDKDVVLGQFSQRNIDLLREHRLLPLEQLFAIDHSSPYYHEQDKGSIFYAESWALTHYLTITDFEQKTHRLTDYLDAVERKVDPVTAASQAFGDIKELQKSLDAYVRGLTFKAFKMKGATEVNDADYKLEPLSNANSEAIRADFLAYNGRNSDAHALIDDLLKQDANNVSARETLGFLAFREKNIDEARKWYAEAVKLDSQSYLANYYYGAMSMNGRMSEDEERDVEASLRTAIKLNPTFAPAYDRLAVLLAMRHRDLDEAHLDTLRAVQMDPANVGFRLNAAYVLMQQQRPDNAVRVLESALKIAKNDSERATVQSHLDRARQYAERQAVANKTDTGEASVSVNSSQPVLRRRASELPAEPTTVSATETEVLPTGPKKTASGTIHAVQCATPAILDFNLVEGGRTTALHSANYYKIAFTAVGFTPSEDLKPCSDIDGEKARVDYIEGPDKKLHVVAIELRK